ncbi:MAG: hypothetical protein ACKOXB_08720 [Flavobacteriales bacterium]
MLQRFLSIFIIVAVLSQGLIKSFILVNYELNKTAITNKYCENKAKPKMHCDGKCHLKKQLKKEEKREKSPLSDNSKEQYEVQFFIDFPQLSSIHPPSAENHLSNYSFSLKTTSPGSIFHPPKC